MKIDEIIQDLKEFEATGAVEYGYEMPINEVSIVIKALEDQKNNWERKYWDLAKSVGGDPNEDPENLE